MNRIEGKSRKWIALTGVLIVAVVAWFTMDGDSPESAKVGWFVLDSAKIRAGAVLIVLSFGVRILLMDRFAARDAKDAAAFKAASEADADVKK